MADYQLRYNPAETLFIFVELLLVVSALKCMSYAFIIVLVPIYKRQIINLDLRRAWDAVTPSTPLEI